MKKLSALLMFMMLLGMFGCDPAINPSRQRNRPRHRQPVPKPQVS